MIFLHDNHNELAKKIGILDPFAVPISFRNQDQESSHAPSPTVFALDENGKILYAQVNDDYRSRPDPAEFIHAWDKTE